MVSRLRIQKDSDEIECIKKASSRAAEIIEGLEISDLKGKKESEIASLLTGSSWRNGCSGVAFDPVVAGGKNTAYPHHLPGEDKITSGWVKIDFGLRYKGYCSDLTRMFILSKFVNNVDSYNMLSVLKEAKQKGVDMLKPGVRCSDIYIEVKKHLDEHDIGKYFIHSLGHGVGIDVHEKPYLKRNSKTILKQSMVVTVEPGFYIPGVGGMRLEDTYLITNKGRERLTRIYQ
ncbi:MAG: M24 family metallopeptidase [Elusimicrobiota bacterium]